MLFKTIKWAGLIILGLLLITVYSLLDPAQYSFFPNCPFLSLTGLECPGCGSQRAVHHLLNLQVSGAFRENPLLVLALPYVLLNFTFSIIERPSERIRRWRNRLFGTQAILILLGLVISFWILRNL